MSVSRHYVLAAGGTGGHMLPAYALAEELIGRGHRVALITDARGKKIPGAPDELAVHELPAGRAQGGPLGWIRAALAIRKGKAAAGQLMASFRPSAVVGFGGYPSLPSLLAARSAKIPTLVHEQNAVLGRVNRLMATRVDAIAVAYSEIQRLPESCRAKTHPVGNPVREEIVALRNEGFPPLDADGIFRLLVVGGSLGATVLSDVVPEAIAMLPPALLARLQVVQQCRADDIDRVRARYEALGVPSELATYIGDMPDRIRWAHLVIARAGASTVAELSCAGRPAIFVPYPSAMDNHQVYNVRDMVKAGGARSIAQPNFTPSELAKQIQKMALAPGALENAAGRALSCGMPEATQDLADLVESTGGAPLMDVIRVGQSARGSAARSTATSSREAK